ncbi:arsinothricin resistance N-acetyltransferase ArsN1 family B [Halomarina pelagica]|uniref:arsinothricin resistance N-acetyltransferase ArsN1 family B n=1 Tax=Halomarina pelagica TaxID=2961599 RepID=UPI0020C26533|nr:arsinothricin resistance N-acetyltransferase ArsN1 family B [Halomarina sp. BND7]
MTAALRLATDDDAPAVRAIYAPYVEETSVTFERTPPSAEEVAERIEGKLERYPWLVCERDDEVVGYAYAGPVRSRAAYRWSTESTVYVREDAKREGVARALYAALFDLLAGQGYWSVYAAVTLPNPASVAFHGATGFERIGVWEAVGFKHGAWHDVGWFRRALGERPPEPDPPLSVAAAREREWWDEALRAGEAELRR